MDFQKLMKQAQAMQAQMLETQAQWDHLEVEGSAGGGLVRVTLNGHSALKAVKIDPSLVNPEEVDVLEDVIKAAFQDAHSRLQRSMQDKMSSMMGGLALPPGLK